MKKKLIFVFAIFFIVTVFHITTQGASDVVSFSDGARNLNTITIATDAITKNWADTLIIGPSGLEKNSGGCRIKLGSFITPNDTQVFFWQGHSWGVATTTATSTAINSCICPAGTTKVLRRSQGNNTISQLDTTWWKDFYYNASPSHDFVSAWTTQCTEYFFYTPPNTPGVCPGESPCCVYFKNNCKDLSNDFTGCSGSTNVMSYTEYLYNCTANSEILKQ